MIRIRIRFISKPVNSGAVKYYRKSVATGESSALRIELANLLQKLGLKDQAIEVLLEGTNSPDKGVSGRETEARCFIELCKIKIDSGDRDEALQVKKRYFLNNSKVS